VTRPGGRIAIADPEWETFVVNCADMSIGRRIKCFLRDSLPGGSTARKRPGLM
jgi:hypothetical protein